MNILTVAALAATCLLGGLGDRFIYYPAKTGDYEPAKVGLPAEDRPLVTSDGVKLHAWWAPKPGARATVLYLHGNAGNMTYHARFLGRLRERVGVNVFAVDYRGYGKSEGEPSEAGLYRDAEAAYAELVDKLGIPPAQIVIHGLSLGTAVATELAMRKPAAALVLEAPFTSMTAMVKRGVPFVDPSLLVSEKYDTLSKAPRLPLPLLVIHGTRDRTIPVAMGRAVFDAAAEPKRFLEVPGAGHVDCSNVAPDDFFGAISTLIDQAVGTRRQAELF